ncbi:type VI secretion system accessory protein TagJ [Rheinheimera baltica]|uniref:Type VI secretion system accessory protein TagJ n=1 Tax=Rheinheimera baltica TaxID=67576 RepID=A0ABT9HUH9_9GAMM|nr:type VI secretion system accessory protein TagJ [Rheinheimera baltica]MDP5134787.1 type VI secretion system accessory protein TagJ [Rheinheimera baltica]MDP5143323.1 type VI secretion system accessory protein TagJ [Rheinheimera baltica]MDP5151157.1 type VI secretion system accessory protein TagJ [Rheinheimera baltica]MDP5191419.1 type VI secretion system accessory protein TagJ [Rheinheimera baltica]
MKQLQTLIKQGELSQATEMAIQLLRDDPANADVRALYIELLCIQGALEKADQQLDMMVRQHPDFLVGAVNLRQLIRAASARQDFYQGGLTATLFAEPDAMFEAQLSLRLALKEQDKDAAVNAATTLESLRVKAEVEINSQHVSDIRDLDDSLGGYLELFGTDGHFYLAKFTEIDSLQLKRPESLLDTVWRRAEIVIKDGPQGEVFVPMTYADSVKISERLGKDTDWQQHDELLVTGIGQKMLLTGEQALALSDIQQLSAVNEVVDA